MSLRVVFFFSLLGLENDRRPVNPNKRENSVSQISVEYHSHIIYVVYSDERVGHAQSGSGEDEAVGHEYGNEKKLHPGHSHLPHREISRSKDSSSCGKDCGGMGEKLWQPHGHQPGKLCQADVSKY